MSPDATRQEEFSGLMVDVLNKGALALLVSVGHQTGLFDTMSTLPPSTSSDIAKAARLDERYVREWLGGMVVGGILEYEPDGATYTLPPEHAASLTTAAGTDNLAGLMPYIALMGEVEQRVVASFREGGVFLMGDIAASSNLEENVGHLFGPAIYSFSVFYCMTTSLSTGGAGLGTVWGEQTARRMLGEAGFTDVQTRSIEGDPLNVYYVARTTPS